MTNVNTKPEPAPAAVHIGSAVALAPDTAAKVAPQADEQKTPVAEPPKS